MTSQSAVNTPNPTLLHQNKGSHQRKEAKKEYNMIWWRRCSRAGKGIFLRGGQRPWVTEYPSDQTEGLLESQQGMLGVYPNNKN